MPYNKGRMMPAAEQLLILVLLLIVLAKSASVALHAAVALSRLAGLTEFVISLAVITFISVLPEAVIVILSALRGSPTLGLGTLIGSNVADLTLIFGTVAAAAPGAVSAEPAFVKRDYVFLGFLLLPLILGFTGYYSRMDGAILTAAGVLFFFIIAEMKRRGHAQYPAHHHHSSFSAAKYLALLAASLAVMAGAAYYAVGYASRIAAIAGLAPALVGLLIVAPGTCLPELALSLRAVRRHHNTLAFGDVLGTVVIDATLVLGILALITPYAFNPRIIIVTGIFMLLAGLLFFALLRSGRRLTRSEGWLLILFYAVFIAVELALRNWTPFIGS